MGPPRRKARAQHGVGAVEEFPFFALIISAHVG
jgi:hypothetical protein